MAVVIFEDKSVPLPTNVIASIEWCNMETCVSYINRHVNPLNSGMAFLTPMLLKDGLMKTWAIAPHNVSQRAVWAIAHLWAIFYPTCLIGKTEVPPSVKNVNYAPIDIGILTKKKTIYFLLLCTNTFMF